MLTRSTSGMPSGSSMTAGCKNALMERELKKTGLGQISGHQTPDFIGKN